MGRIAHRRSGPNRAPPIGAVLRTADRDRTAHRRSGPNRAPPIGTEPRTADRDRTAHRRSGPYCAPPSRTPGGGDAGRLPLWAEGIHRGAGPTSRPTGDGGAAHPPYPAGMCTRYWAASVASPPAGPVPAERIGDADRERASTELRRHFTEGRLDTEEFSARLEEVWSAKTGSDLAHALRELPRPPVGPPPAATHRRHPRTFRPVLAIVVGVALLAGARWVGVWLLAAAVFVVVRRLVHRARAFNPPAAAPR